MSSLNIVLVIALVGLFLDGVRHVVMAWSVQLQSARLYERKRPMTQSAFWLAEVLHLPYPAASAAEADRYGRNVRWFLAEMACFAFVFAISAIVNSV